MSVYTIIARLKQHKFFSEFFTDTAQKQFKKNLVTGFTSFGLEYTIFTLCNWVGLWYIYSNTIAYVIIFWFNFLMNRFWSFQSKDNLGRQLVLFGMLFAFNLGATNVLIYFLSDIIGIIPAISKIIVMGAVVSWNFIIYKKVIYR